MKPGADRRLGLFLRRIVGGQGRRADHGKRGCRSGKRRQDRTSGREGCAMKTVTIECRKYDEWDSKTQSRLVDIHRDINTDEGWDEWVLEDAKEVGRLVGIEIEKVLYSGFSRQGDGACFVGTYRYAPDAGQAIRDYAPTDEKLHEIAEGLKALKRRWLYGFALDINHQGSDCHEYTTQFTFRCTGDAVAKEYRDEVIRLMRELMRWIYTRLESEFFSLMEDDSVAETLRCNNYEMDSNGVIH